MGQGKGKMAIKAKYAEIDGKILGSLFYGKTPNAGIKAAVFDFAASILLAAPYTITVPPNSGTFVADLAWSLLPPACSQRVASAPRPASTASPLASTPSHRPMQAGLALSYEYSATSTSARSSRSPTTSYYTPSFTLLLQNGYDGKNLVMKLNRCVSGKPNILLKNDDSRCTTSKPKPSPMRRAALGYICLY